MKIRTGDTVKILYGKNAGKQGRVVKVYRDEMKVVVEGINEHKKHVKGDGRSRKSEILTVVKPLPVSKVMLVEPESGKPTRVRMNITNDGKERVSVRSGKAIDVKVTVKNSKEESKTNQKKLDTTKSKNERKPKKSEVTKVSKSKAVKTK